MDRNGNGKTYPVLRQELVGYKLIAERMLVIAGNLEQMAKHHRYEGLEEDDAVMQVLESSRDWLINRANVFRPPGLPKEGYAPEANVVNLDSFRALKEER